MSHSPMTVGDLLPQLSASLTTQSDKPLQDITLATFTLVIRDVKTGVKRFGGGTFTVIDATHFTYAWASIDTATIGDYTLQVVITYPGGKPVSTRPVPWKVVDYGVIA